MGIVSQYRQDITSGIDEALVDKIGSATLTTTAKNLSGAVNELNARTTELGTELEATQVWIADEYDTTRTYAVDDMVSYENELYKCITAVTSPEAFDDNKWEATGVSYELSQHDSKLRQHDSDISALNSSLANIISSDARNNIGAIVSLDSYTSTNYTCPSDGYVRCDCSASTTAKSVVDITGATTGSFRMGGWANGTYGMYICYVKKGMKVHVVTLENSGHVWFYPLI